MRKITLISKVFVVIVNSGSDFRVWKQRILVIKDMKIMFIYSAIKMKANIPDEYSVLNPETNSLSPSAKSNGARLDSANIVVNHTNRSKGVINQGFIIFFSTSI